MMKVVFVACALFATLALAQERNGFQVTIENLSGGSELPSELSPVVWSVHSGVTPLFNPTRAASDSLQMFAEDALPLPLLAEVESGETNGVKDAGVAYYHRQSESGALPGQTFQFGVMGERGDRLSFVTQFCETNDRFFGSSQDGFSLYDENGAPQSGFVDVVLYDAGTEINERPGSGVNQKARQPRINVGQNENSVVLDSLHNIDEFVYPATKTVIRVRVTACVTFRCKLDNLSAGSTLPSALAPLAFAVHLQENVFFVAGERASAGLEAAAEDGNVALAIEEAFNQTGTLFVGSTPPVTPSSSIEFDITVPQGARVSFVSMLVATNDRFYAPFPRGVNLFDNEGPVDGAITDIELWDAGTELNERPGQGANQPPAQGGPSEPNGFVKHALADRDTYSYPLTEEVIALSVAPLTGQGFTSSSFEQKLNVNFVFSNMIKPQA